MLTPFSCMCLLDRSFESEINYSNPLGTGGRLAIGFAVLLRALWKGTHHAFQPSKLKVRPAMQAHTGCVVFSKSIYFAFMGCNKKLKAGLDTLS